MKERKREKGERAGDREKRKNERGGQGMERMREEGKKRENEEGKVWRK